MKPKQMMLFAIAIGCGLVAMIGAHQILSGNRAPEQQMVDILVSKLDIDPGVPLDDSNVGLRKWPVDTVPEGAITKREDWAERSLKIHASPNMPIVTNFLAAKGAVGITSLIPSGMRAISLPVDAAQAHSGLLRPNSYVTISCTIVNEQRDNNRRPSTQIKTVLNKVKVIAVNNQIAGSEESKKDGPTKIENITLVVFPMQEKLLLLAKSLSRDKIHTAILPEGDKSSDDSRDLDDADFAKRSSDLLGEKSIANETIATIEKVEERPSGNSFSNYLKEQVVTPGVAELGKGPSESVWKIEIYRGDKKEIQEVELPQLPDSTSSNEQRVEKNWTAPIMKFFSGKRSAKSPVQETHSKPPGELEMNFKDEKSATVPTDALRQ